MREIVFATNNQHKLDEIRKITGGRLRILSLADIDCHEEIEETGSTLEENALIKAGFVREKYGYDCFADDTGLEVGALDGAPGVYSSRYAGNGCNPADNMDKLLLALKGAENRSAQFRTVIALVINGKEHLFDGVIKGKIIEEKRGTTGFGYDPIFMPDGYDKTFAELGNEVKNSISHRALAMEKLVGFLLKN
ncbi:Non-canonical purine NTP pyrophosphatase [Proteiniphilum saccharofermentans]|uniref:dITP/XTP pyrophosphatase n=1 Tax=Proteiniphilum saccharofermentans TaxID=1642647 RepID=A0A1R3SZ38_9BACT|nr:non-canonical purine NTP diphosphatase [Proteiniphilum saccharofermentans]SCD19062.1 Non-canonical purine NTP pyrophosphatase [Proteiniphilum saccharofermentans]